MVNGPNDGAGAVLRPARDRGRPAGTLLVTDTGNHRIERFDADGKFLAAYGGRGAGDGQFAEPAGIAVDKGGNFYVADTWNSASRSSTRRVSPSPVADAPAGTASR